MYRKELSRLTIVIPTYTRQAYALRSMRYWSGRGPVVHVLDGSPDAIHRHELVGLNGNIHYHHLPIGINDRLSYVLGFIQSKYVAFLPDDEFLIPSAVATCMRELDAEPDMVACVGRVMLFSPSPYGIVGAPGYLSQENYSVAQNDPVERMIYHMVPYRHSIFYAVHRSESWLRVVRLIVEKEFPVYAMWELQMELATCFLGKSKVIQSLMRMRSGENPQLSGTSISLNPENRIWDWWLDSETEQEKNKFLEIMSRGLASSPKEIAKVRMGVVRAIDAYINAYKDLPIKHSLIWHVEDAIRRALPRFLRGAMKKLVFPLRRLQGQGTPLFEAARALADTGVVIDFNELASIESLVLEFHQQLKKQQ